MHTICKAAAAFVEMFRKDPELVNTETQLAAAYLTIGIKDDHATFLAAGLPAKSVAAVIDFEAWSFAEIDQLSASSVVGAMCIALMVRTDYLIAQMPDIHVGDVERMRETARAQCETWLFG